MWPRWRGDNCVIQFVVRMRARGVRVCLCVGAQVHPMACAWFVTATASYNVVYRRQQAVPVRVAHTQAHRDYQAMATRTMRVRSMCAHLNDGARAHHVLIIVNVGCCGVGAYVRVGAHGVFAVCMR